MPKRRGETNKNRYIPENEYREIIGYLTAENRAVTELLRMTGYRLNDLLTTRNYQWQGETIKIKEEKTGKIREKTITPEMRKEINKYRRARNINKAHRLEYTFSAHKRGRSTDRHKTHRTTIYRAFLDAVKKAGYEGRGYTIHSVRHIYAHEELARQGGDFYAIQEDMGHKYLSTTLLYCYT